MQKYDLDNSKGYPIAEMVPDDLGDYYLVTEVDAALAEKDDKFIAMRTHWFGIRKALNEKITALTEVLEDKRRLTKDLDVILNGEGAAKQASLCDIVAQLRKTRIVQPLIGELVSLRKEFSESEQQIAALQSDTRRLYAKTVEQAERIDELQTELEGYAWEISPAMAEAKMDQLFAENQKYREALEKIESMATIETIEIQKIAQDALKQEEVKAT